MTRDMHPLTKIVIDQLYIAIIQENGDVFGKLVIRRVNALTSSMNTKRKDDAEKVLALESFYADTHNCAAAKSLLAYNTSDWTVSQLWALENCEGTTLSVISTALLPASEYTWVDTPWSTYDERMACLGNNKNLTLDDLEMILGRFLIGPCVIPTKRDSLASCLFDAMTDEKFKQNLSYVIANQHKLKLNMESIRARARALYGVEDHVSDLWMDRMLA